MKILFPVSSGTIDQKVLAWFSEVAQKFAAQIDILNVQHNFESFSSANSTYPLYPEFAFSPELSNEVRDNLAMKNAKNIAETAQKKLSSELKNDITIHALAMLGEPAAVIIDAAEKGSYDLIVLRDRDRTDVGRFLLGSITDRVVHHAKIAVMVLK